MKSNRYCAICNKIMEHHNAIAYVDFTCRNDPDHHFLIERFKDNQLVKLKTRLSDNNEKIYMKLHLDLNKIEVWTKTNDMSRISINGIFDPDFSDLNKLKQKIKKYLLFS